MNRPFIFLVLLANLLFSPLSRASELSIEDAWIREAPPVSKVQAAYMHIHNRSSDDIAITSASSPLFTRIEFHRTEMTNGLMRMLQEDTLTIPAKGEKYLQPDGTHMMLFNPQRPLKAGDKVPVTLRLGEHGAFEFEVTVKKAGDEAHHHHQHH